MRNMSIDGLLMKLKQKWQLRKAKEYLIAEFEAEGRDKRIIKAFRKIPREDFMLPEYKEKSYDDHAYLLTDSQTISQPSTIADMLELLEIKEDSKILEIGAGCGYNAALLSRLTKQTVYSIERIHALAESAKKNLKKIGIKNVVIIEGDGSKGYEKEAPYDRIIATCACKEILDAWKEQLKENGIIVAPVGEDKYKQDMVAARKINGMFHYTKHGYYKFVPLVRD